jgi:hypothetical protein
MRQEIIAVLAKFAPLFALSVFARVQVLVLGDIFALGNAPRRKTQRQ